jgi:hypothetical protein
MLPVVSWCPCTLHLRTGWQVSIGTMPNLVEALSLLEFWEWVECWPYQSVSMRILVDALSLLEFREWVACWPSQFVSMPLLVEALSLLEIWEWVACWPYQSVSHWCGRLSKYRSGEIREYDDENVLSGCPSNALRCSDEALLRSNGAPYPSRRCVER